MPGQVFSTRLASAQFPVSTGFGTHAFTVPAGQRAVIRHVAVSQGFAAGAQVLLYNEGTGRVVFRAATPQETAYVHEDVRLTFHEGERCSVRCLINPADVTLDGFLLVGGGGPLTVSSLPTLPP